MWKRLRPALLLAALGIPAFVSAALAAGLLIEQLTPAAPLSGADIVAIVQGSSPAKQTTVGAIGDFLAGRTETLTNKTIDCVTAGVNTCSLPSSIANIGSGTGPQIAQYPSGTGTAVVPVTLSGDCILAEGGAITCLSTNGSPFAPVATSGSASDLGTGLLPDARLNNIVTAGSCTNCNLTYDAHGRVTLAANGTSGGGGGTTWTVHAVMTGNQTLDNTFVGQIVQNTTAQAVITMPASTVSVFAPGSQVILLNQSTDVQSVARTSPSSIYGVPLNGTNVTIPAGGGLRLIADSSNNFLAIPIQPQTSSQHITSSTSRTAGALDCNYTTVFTAATAITATIPTGLPLGCHLEMYQQGAGQITVAAGTGETARSPHGYTKSFAQYSLIGAFIDSASTYVFYGDGA